MSKCNQKFEFIKKSTGLSLSLSTPKNNPVMGYDITCESHQNCLKTKFMNNLSGFGNNHFCNLKIDLYMSSSFFMKLLHRQAIHYQKITRSNLTFIHKNIGIY